MSNGQIPTGGSAAYRNHGVAIVGYVTSMNNFIAIHDTSDDTNYHLIQGYSWNGIMTP